MKQARRTGVALGKGTVLVALCGLVAANAVVGLAAVRTTVDDVVAIENEFFRMAIDPARGGAVTSFFHKAAGTEVVPRGREYTGLFLDHLWGQDWPGELMEVPYEVKLEEHGPDEAVVRLWRRTSGEWRGATQKMFEGLLIEKTFRVESGTEAVFCRVRITNTRDEARMPAYWLQNVFFIGGDYDLERDVFYRPSARGVRATSRSPRTREEDFLRDPYAGWSAAIDEQKRHGLLWLMDYNYLDMLYNSLGNTTLEWMYDKVPIPAGRTWQTDVVMVPFAGFEQLAHASGAFMAALSVERRGGDVMLGHRLRATTEPVEDVTLGARFEGILDHERTSAPPLAVGRLTREVREVAQTVPVACGDPMMIWVNARGKRAGRSFEETYLVFHSGGYGFGGDNLQPDGVTPLYADRRPEKKQALMRPERIVRERDEKLHVFVMEGLHTDCYRIGEALALAEGAAGGEPVVRRGFYRRSGIDARITDFPFDYVELMRQDVIFISNVNIQCLGRLGLEMLADYASHGGNLVILGGKASYGAGGLRASALKELLPLEVEEGPFDIEHVDGASIVRGEPHGLTESLDLTAQPVCHYIHRVKAKEGAGVLLRAGARPFLVVAELEGGGRAACFLGAPFGPEGGKGSSPLFYAWDRWPSLLADVVLWVSNGRIGPGPFKRGTDNVSTRGGFRRGD